MVNLNYCKDNVHIDKTNKFLTVGELIGILSEVNPQTKVFIRNLDEWGGKPYIENMDSCWELSDGLITDVKKANIDQVTGEEEYIIIQGMINKQGLNTLDYEPYEEIIYHHTWLDKMLNRFVPITSMKQLRDKYLKIKHNCGNCRSNINNICSKSKLQVLKDDDCELWECRSYD